MQEEHQETGSGQEHNTPSHANEEPIIVRRGTKYPGVTPVQETALRRLFAGSSIAQAARAAKVDRRTLSRWLHDDPHFAAAYNAWRQEMIASGRARVLAMNDLALDTVQNAMLQGNVRVAVQVAKANGALDAPKPGTTDPSYFYHRKTLRDRARREAIEDRERKEYLAQANAPERNPSHCEYMIDSYIKCRRDALRAESPEDRARRLEQQPQYRRNYDPMTLRLFRTLDAEEPLGEPPAAVPAGRPADTPPADGRDAGASAAHPPASATEAHPEAEATDRATESNATDTPAPAVVTTDVPPSAASGANPDAPIESPVPPAQPAAFPGARPAQADPPEPPPAPPRRPAPIRAVPYDGSDEDDNEPGWTKLI
ncbi:MAG TPA: hypothetical protein VGI81_25275 [Tepidisphaeraceae bacterium]|jgi:hypothetical protein